MTQNMVKNPKLWQVNNAKSRQTPTKNRVNPPVFETGTAPAIFSASHSQKSGKDFEGQVQGSMEMFDVKEIGKSLSIAICAVLFGSTMVLSAVGPARAETMTQASAHQSPETVRYLA
jgi:hypothetical protein